MRLRLIAFTGGMGAGKSTAAELLKASGNAAIVKFAQPLYDMQKAIYNIAGVKLEGKDRKLLQYLGTEWGRSIDKDLWVKLWEERVRYLLERDKELVIICDDCRFDNEAQAVRALGGKVVEITTTATRIDKVNAGHVSEKGVTRSLIDKSITNDGDVEALNTQLREYLVEHFVQNAEAVNV